MVATKSWNYWLAVVVLGGVVLVYLQSQLTSQGADKGSKRRIETTKPMVLSILQYKVIPKVFL
jgi:hypothetical protein